jgi:hypothetical protein
MEVRIENTPPAGTNNDSVRCFVAIELSKSSWVLGFQMLLAKQTSRYQVKACDAKALLELIERVRSRVVRELGRPVEMMSCYEAGYASRAGGTRRPQPCPRSGQFAGEPACSEMMLPAPSRGAPETRKKTMSGISR